MRPASVIQSRFVAQARCYPDWAGMGPNERDEQVARAWNRLQRNWWAHDEVFRACDKQPRRAWRLLGRLADLATTPELVSDLGAGPLEDFIRSHAPQFIAQIEHTERAHPFRVFQDARVERWKLYRWRQQNQVVELEVGWQKRQALGDHPAGVDSAGAVSDQRYFDFGVGWIG